MKRCRHIVAAGLVLIASGCASDLVVTVERYQGPLILAEESRASLVHSHARQAIESIVMTLEDLIRYTASERTAYSDRNDLVREVVEAYADADVATELAVLCEALADDTPSNWKNAKGEAVARLREILGNRQDYLSKQLKAMLSREDGKTEKPNELNANERKQIANLAPSFRTMARRKETEATKSARGLAPQHPYQQAKRLATQLWNTIDWVLNYNLSEARSDKGQLKPGGLKNLSWRVQRLIDMGRGGISLSHMDQVRFMSAEEISYVYEKTTAEPKPGGDSTGKYYYWTLEQARDQIDSLIDLSYLFRNRGADKRSREIIDGLCHFAERFDALCAALESDYPAVKSAANGKPIDVLESWPEGYAVRLYYRLKYAYSNVSALGNFILREPEGSCPGKDEASDPARTHRNQQWNDILETQDRITRHVRDATLTGGHGSFGLSKPTDVHIAAIQDAIRKHQLSTLQSSSSDQASTFKELQRIWAANGSRQALGDLRRQGHAAGVQDALRALWKPPELLTMGPLDEKALTRLQAIGKDGMKLENIAAVRASTCHLWRVKGRRRTRAELSKSQIAELRRALGALWDLNGEPVTVTDELRRALTGALGYLWAPTVKFDFDAVTTSALGASIRDSLTEFSGVAFDDRMLREANRVLEFLRNQESAYTGVHSIGDFLSLDEASWKRPGGRSTWEKVTEVRAEGGAKASYVVMRDHLGNWQVRGTKNDPTELINAAYGATTATIDILSRQGGGSIASYLQGEYQKLVDRARKGGVNAWAMEELYEQLKKSHAEAVGKADADIAKLREQSAKENDAAKRAELQKRLGSAVQGKLDLLRKYDRWLAQVASALLAVTKE